jgi:hypothetical protein
MGKKGEHKLPVGSTHKTIYCDEFKVIDRFVTEAGISRTVIQYTETGFVATHNSDTVNRLNTKDWSKPTVYGVGYCSDQHFSRMITSPDGKRVSKPSYECWNSMLKRCYSESSKSYPAYGARGVTVCKEWLDYAVFAKWYDENYVEGFEIDKDIHSDKFKGYEYNPEVCVFVPKRLNTFFTNSRSVRGLYPVGVSKKFGRRGKFRYTSYYSNENQIQTSAGVYDTMHEAFMAYKVNRERVLKTIAEEYFQAGSIHETTYKRLLGWQAVPYP